MVKKNTFQIAQVETLTQPRGDKHFAEFGVEGLQRRRDAFVCSSSADRHELFFQSRVRLLDLLEECARCLLFALDVCNLLSPTISFVLVHFVETIEILLATRFSTGDRSFEPFDLVLEVRLDRDCQGLDRTEHLTARPSLQIDLQLDLL
jgi:hypothetical protein